jgi:predicted negative regulator of RcsB-dependent stress response
VSDHLSRKDLKQDKIHDALEHGAEAVYTHKQTAIVVLVVVLIVAAAYGGWSIYHERQTAAASAAFDTAMKAYSGHLGSSPDPAEVGDPSYADETARSNDALQKFNVVADKYPSTRPGMLARYYAALCLEDLDKENQAVEELKKLSNGSDKELASMAQYQTAILYSRTGKGDEAAKIFRALSDKPSVFVTRPLALLELAGVLRQTNPKEAATVYQQVKKEFPESAISEEADRGLDTLGPKS